MKIAIVILEMIKLFLIDKARFLIIVCVW